MDNNNLLFVAGGTTLMTIICIYYALRRKKVEVDNALQQHKQDINEQIFLENNSLSLFEPKTVASHQSLPFNEQRESVINLIDWNVLQNYSDHLSYWISNFDFAFAANLTMLPFTVVLFILSGAPFTVLKPMPLTRGDLYLVKDVSPSEQKYKDLLVELLSKANEQSEKLAYLEYIIIDNMEQTTQEARYNNYNYIKSYALKHNISEKLLINIYLNVLHLKQYGVIKTPLKLTLTETTLSITINNMLKKRIIAL